MQNVSVTRIGPHGVGDQVPQQHARRRGADDARREHELLVFDAHNLGADDARHVGPVVDAQRDENAFQPRPDHDHQQNDVDHRRHAADRVDDAHHHVVGTAAHETGDAAVDHADRQVDQAGHQADGQGDARAVHDAHEHVASEHVGAERMRPRGELVGDEKILFVVGVGRKQRPEDRHQKDADDQEQSEHRQLVAFEALPGVLPVRLAGADELRLVFLLRADELEQRRVVQIGQADRSRFRGNFFSHRAFPPIWPA